MLALATYSPLFLLPFGRHYQIGATALSIIAAAMLVSLGTGNNGVMLLMGGGSAANLFVSATSLALNIVGNLLLIPHLGLTGAAVSWAIAILTTNVLTSILLWVRLKMHPFGRDFAYVALSALACYGVLGIIGQFSSGVDFYPPRFSSSAEHPSMFSLSLWLARRSSFTHSPLSFAAGPLPGVREATGYSTSGFTSL